MEEWINVPLTIQQIRHIRFLLKMYVNKNKKEFLKEKNQDKPKILNTKKFHAEHDAELFAYLGTLLPVKERYAEEKEIERRLNSTVGEENPETTETV